MAHTSLTQKTTKNEGAMEIHRILGDKVRLYRRTEGGAWHCSTYLKSKEWRKSTKQKSLAKAKDVATDWYMELCARDHYGDLKTGKTFAEVAKVFEQEYEASTRGHRSPKWVQGHKDRIRLHLMPYFGKKTVSEITSGEVQAYRVHRMTKPEADTKTDQKAGKANGKGKDGKKTEPQPWKPPARNTIHNEVVTLSMVLKTAQRHGWLENLPDLSDPYRRQSKVEHRPWFTPNEYKQLYEATRKNAASPKSSRYKWHAEQLHDFVLFMANTGLRPDEVKHLEFRDVTIVTDEYSGDRIQGHDAWASRRGPAPDASGPPSAPSSAVFRRLPSIRSHVRRGSAVSRPSSGGAGTGRAKRRRSGRSRRAERMEAARPENGRGRDRDAAHGSRNRAAPWLDRQNSRPFRSI
tara:strand:- start:8970 stop:10187 length:1218 start_codon:yes stop_codon:yes gene_type:complete